jgi:hypothetical protein
MQGRGQGQGQNLSGLYGQESGLRAGLLILIVFFIARGGLPPRAHNIGIRLKSNFTKICTEGVRTYVDLTTYRRPQSQSNRKVPITINPVQGSRASQLLASRRSTKLAVGALAALPIQQSQYNRFLRLVVAYGDGYSVPPIRGALEGGH